MEIDAKNIIFGIIGGFLGALAVYLITYDAIAFEAMEIRARYGWGYDLSYYTTLSLTRDYMEILKGIIVIYGSIGEHIISFLTNNIGDIFSTNFQTGSPMRFFFTIIFPFLSATIFAGLTSKGLKEYVISAIVAPIVFIVFGFALAQNYVIQILINGLYVAFIGMAFGFPLGLVINLIASRSFEEEEKKEEELVVEEDIEIEEDIEGEIEL